MVKSIILPFNKEAKFKKYTKNLFNHLNMYNFCDTTDSHDHFINKTFNILKIL